MNSKKLIIFDLDDTLAPSKSAMDSEMGELLGRLLDGRFAAVISGGRLAQIQTQLLPALPGSAKLAKLFILPMCGSAFYKHENSEWREVYALNFSDDEKTKIYSAFENAFVKTDYLKPIQIFGDTFEDRGSQVTFSALGQRAPLEAKRGWDPAGVRRLSLIEAIAPTIPEFEVRLGGTTSIDVTRKGIDKAYGVLALEKYLRVKKENMLFIGDRIFPGGNDYPVKALGVECVEVKGPEDTKKVLRGLLR